MRRINSFRSSRKCGGSIHSDLAAIAEDPFIQDLAESTEDQFIQDLAESAEDQFIQDLAETVEDKHTLFSHKALNW